MNCHSIGLSILFFHSIPLLFSISESHYDSLFLSFCLFLCPSIWSASISSTLFLFLYIQSPMSYLFVFLCRRLSPISPNPSISYTSWLVYIYCPISPPNAQEFVFLIITWPRPNILIWILISIADIFLFLHELATYCHDVNCVYNCTQYYMEMMTMNVLLAPVAILNLMYHNLFLGVCLQIQCKRV